MVVVGVTRAASRPVPVRRGSTERGFRVKNDSCAQTGATVGTAGVAMASLLAMQEFESDAQQDRETRRHGEAMLDELSELHLALLGADGPDLGRLAKLVERPVTTSDPGLAGVLRAVRLRAGLELARRARDASM